MRSAARTLNSLPAHPTRSTHLNRTGEMASSRPRAHPRLPHKARLVGDRCRFRRGNLSFRIKSEKTKKHTKTLYSQTVTLNYIQNKGKATIWFAIRFVTVTIPGTVTTTRYYYRCCYRYRYRLRLSLPFPALLPLPFPSPPPSPLSLPLPIR